MKRIALLLAFLISTQAFASKGTIVSGNVLNGFHNVLQNGSFDFPTSAYGWTVTTASGAKDATNFIDGVQSEQLTFSSSTGDIAESLIPAIQTNTVNMQASCWVKTSLTTIQVCALSGGTEVFCQNVPSIGAWTPVAANFVGPSNGTSVGVRVKTTASTTGTVNVDDCYVGPATNLSQVSQAQWYGSLTLAGASGCNFSNNTSSETTFASLGAGSGCNAWSATGQMTAPSTNSMSIPLNNAAPGTYQFVIHGMLFHQLSSTNQVCNTRLSDGTLTSTSGTSFFAAANSIGYPDISGTFTYDTAGNHTINVQVATTSTEPCGFFPNASGRNLKVDVFYFPSQSQLAISQQTPPYPTVQVLTSGTTYTRPAGVKWIDVKMVGGGAGGGSGGTGSPTAGGNGGDTVFSDWTAGKGSGGGVGAQQGGSGGTNTVGTGTAIINVAGASGSAGATIVTGSSVSSGGGGGSSPFGGAGGATYYGQTGNPAIAHSGSGASGGGATSGNGAGAGGGAGGYLEFQINNPSATYTYSVGSGGSAGTGGTSGYAGGAGGSGIIIVTEYYGQFNAPAFVGSVTSSSAGQEHVERVYFGGSSEPSNCTSDPCTLYSNTPGVTAVNRNATGTYTINFASGTFSGTPSCSGGLKAISTANTAFSIEESPAPSSTAVKFVSLRTTNAAADSFGMVTCQGPH